MRTLSLINQLPNVLKNAGRNYFPIGGYLYKKIYKIPIQTQSEALKAQSSLACYLSAIGTIGAIYKSSVLGVSMFGISAIISYRNFKETENFERLEIAINSLNKVNSDLKRSYRKFKENSNEMIENLKNTNKDFESQNDTLKKEIEKLQELVEIARMTNDQLFQLQQRHGVTANLYQTIGKDLEKVKDSFENQELSFGEKIQQLSTEISRLQELKV